MSYVHYGELEQVTDEHHLRYGESNGSTNGSSLTRSRNTVAEENLYTTVSPTAGHPNNMGQYFFFLKDCGTIWFFDNSVFVDEIVKNLFYQLSEYEIIGEGSQILTNQKRESTVFSLLIGRNLRPFPDNFVLYTPLLLHRIYMFKYCIFRFVDGISRVK